MLKAEFNFDQEVMAALRVMAESEKRSPEALLSDLIRREYQARREDLPAEILPDLKARHRELREGGQAVDWEEADRWISRWLDEEEPPAPKKCRVW